MFGRTSIFDKILARNEFTEKPLVFIDVGASGGIHDKWKKFSKMSICLAFDPDDRDFCVDTNSHSEKRFWHRLYVFNRIVAETSAEKNFYLTSSPHCSSTLPPRTDCLRPWLFSPLFSIENTIKQQSVTLSDCLSNVDIGYVDWIKTDSQGTDLRIYASLPISIRNAIIVAEFEPGIIDAYLGEDKLSAIMSFMDDPRWWISELAIRGSARFDLGDLHIDGLRASASRLVRISPGWGGIQYMNTMALETPSVRSLLASWMFAFSEDQLGHCLFICKLGQDLYSDPIFAELTAYTVRSLNSVKRWALAMAAKLLRRAAGNIINY
jgi:hypothetical protein